MDETQIKLGDSSTIARSKKRHAYFSGNNDVSIRSGAEFRDSEAWGEMFQKHLGRYTQPKWSAICEPGVMRLWLDRLDMDEDRYFEMTKTTLQDFINLNLGWPLLSWLGTVLELRPSK